MGDATRHLDLTQHDAHQRRYGAGNTVPLYPLPEQLRNRSLRCEQQSQETLTHQ
ncbi:hypothetical protein C9Z53_22770 [Escherichia coli]|nr:hypothetical protein C9323_23035 [Escherichia coli]TJA49814.1 hypothetical protein C9312_22895 [Escherichia coli]TJH34059.1 hypothetical protein C9156_21985 [Escherichia coli]TJH61786.1 hypothetical protein C9149_21685 [Escherichia coli]TJH72569.1 hypothetical protein C9150_21720 [Escherichia coli]